jgi:iron complex outermembrane receptor protein
VLSLCLSLSGMVQAQTGANAPTTGRLSGKVADAKAAPIAYATMTLLREDSTVVNGDLSKDDGSFSIFPTGNGSFILRINAIGYDAKYISGITISPSASEKNLGNIGLAINAKLLGEVEVVGEKAMVEMSFDKRVFNVEKNTTATGGSATDVLKNIPSLAVDVDGNVALRGKETTILIDGKPATLLGGDVASALQSLPASSIATVEVITNPSAKYDAQGMAGIINIVTRRDSRFGLNGNASIGAGTRDKYNGSLGLNLRNNKWNLFFNSNYKRNRNYQRTSNERFAPDGTLTAASYEDNMRTFGGFFNTIGAEYTIDKNNTITFTENLNSMLWGNKGATDYLQYNNGEPLRTQARSSSNLGKPLSSSSSLDYKHKFAKPGQELSANATFAKTWVHRDQEFVTSYLDGSGTPFSPTMTQFAPGGGTNASLNSQVDFTTPFATKTGKLDAGLKSQLYWFESSNNATRDTGTGFFRDVVLQNDYVYDQKIYAAYASYSDQKGKWGYQAGLRSEYARYSGTSSAVGGKRYANEFLNLFPSAYLSFKPSQTQAMYLSYTRRINRPGFFQLMPYIDVSNPQDTSSGNPALIPEFIHNTELNWSRNFKQGHLLMASAYFQYTQNLMERVRRFYADGTSFQQPQNLSSGTTYGLELTGKAQLLKMWDATVNVNFFENRILGTNIDPTLDNSGYSWFAKLASNLRLPKGFSLQANGTYEAPKVAAQGKTQEVWFVDLALKKALWSNKASLVLNVSDIFNTRKYTTDYSFPGGATQSIYRDRETRIGNLTFTYRFGKSDTKAANRRAKDNSLVPVKDRDNIKQSEGDGGGGF